MFDAIVAVVQLVLMAVVLGLLTNILWNERYTRDWSYYLACIFVGVSWMIVIDIFIAAMLYTPV